MDTPDHAANTTITGHEELVLTFTDSMDTLTLSLSGNMGTALETENIAWSTTTYNNDTLTLTPNPVVGTRHLWPEGSSTLIVECTTAEGPVMDSTTVSYTVENAVYVRDLDGDDINKNGTKDSPKATVQIGINLADDLYTTGTVYVAEGTYPSSSAVADMAEGISIYGGYSEDNWEWRNTSNYETILINIANSGGSITTPNSAVYADSAVGSDVILDGFTIIVGVGAVNAGIFSDGSSMVIQNNLINGRETTAVPSSRSIGIRVTDGTPQITANNIDAKWSGGNSSYGIYTQNSDLTISGNDIDGGEAAGTYGIVTITSGSPQIINNNIEGGNGLEARGINIIGGTPSISENFITFEINLNGHGIYEQGSGPSALVNNNIYPPRTGFYYDMILGNLLGISSGNFYQDFDCTLLALSTPAGIGNISEPE